MLILLWNVRYMLSLCYPVKEFASDADLTHNDGGNDRDF